MMRNHAISRRFGGAVATYDAHSGLQRHAALGLAERIAGASLPAHPRVLEIGCGTGHLSELLARRLASAVPGDTASHNFLLTDIAPAMVAACRHRLADLPQLRYAVMDGERPAVAGGFDLVCANLATQWFRRLGPSLAGLAALLAPGGVLAVTVVSEDTFTEWRAAHRALGLTAGTPDFPAVVQLPELFPAAGKLQIDEERHLDHPSSPLEFLRALRAIGADTPTPGHRPLSAGELRRVLRQLGAAPAVTYHLIYALWRKRLEN